MVAFSLQNLTYERPIHLLNIFFLFLLFLFLFLLFLLTRPSLSFFIRLLHLRYLISVFLFCSYSENGGECWHSSPFSPVKWHFTGLTADPNALGMKMTLWGYTPGDGLWQTVTLDFGHVIERFCKLPKLSAFLVLVIKPVTICSCVGITVCIRWNFD